MTPITVLLAEDHLVVREGLRALLKSESDIEVVGEAWDGRTAVQLTKALLPAVVVMDIAMPLLNGLEATRQILKAVPATRVLILSAHSDDEYVEQTAALGAAGYLIKQTSAALLATAIRDVHAGRTVFSPAISRHLLDRRQGSTSRTGRLSSREVEVLQLIAEGKANKQAAAEMGISIKTVEKHRQHLMGKLDIHDTAGLTRYAIAAGVIESALKLTMSDRRPAPRLHGRVTPHRHLSRQALVWTQGGPNSPARTENPDAPQDPGCNAPDRSRNQRVRVREPRRAAPVAAGCRSAGHRSRNAPPDY